MADFNLLRQVQTDRNRFHGSAEGRESDTKSPTRQLTYWERRRAEKSRPQNKRGGRDSPSRRRPPASVKVSFGAESSGQGSAKARKNSVMAAASVFEDMQVRDVKKYRTISPRDGAIPREVLEMLRNQEEGPDPESEEETVDPNDKGAVARSSLAAKISAYNDANKCPTCQQAVYDGPDQSMVDGKRYHNWCFRCVSCDTKLSTGTGNYRSTNDRNFCQRCYDMLYNLAAKKKFQVSGMSDQDRERHSNLVKMGTKESQLSWDNAQAAPSLVSGWLDKSPEKPAAPKFNPPGGGTGGDDSRASTPYGFDSSRASTPYGFGDIGSDSDEFDAESTIVGSQSVDRKPSVDSRPTSVDVADENPFSNAGAVDGVEIWRVEKKEGSSMAKAVKKINKAVRDKPDDYVGVDAHRGTLYDGDVYIFFCTTTRANGKRNGEIYMWVGSEATDQSASVGTKFLPKLKGEVRRAFGDIIARRIDQGNEGAFFSKFKDAYANKRKKFALGYKEGAYEDGFVIADDDMQAAAAAFVDRLVKVHIEDNEVLVSEVPCEPASMTNDAVFLLETFGKVWQYNGIKCNPVERNEGRNKFQAMSAEVEEMVASSRTRSLDYVDIMQTRSEASALEKAFFTQLEGRGLPWKPLSRRQLKTLKKTMSRLAMKSNSAYKGQRWDVNDTTLYEHSTSYFGGRQALGPGRRTSTQAQPFA